MTKDDYLTFWDDQERVCYFQVGDTEYTSRGAKGKAVSKSSAYLSGATITNGDNLFWFHGLYDAPKSVNVSDAPYGTKVTDKGLTMVAKGIKKAVAIWSE